MLLYFQRRGLQYVLEYLSTIVIWLVMLRWVLYKQNSCV
jgi:hypothetical protein